jgi:signal transduction histidine kinase
MPGLSPIAHADGDAPLAHAGADAASRLTTLSQAIGATAFLAGILVLGGWVFHLPGLNHVHPTLGQMNSHTAVCFTLAGLGLWLSREEPVRSWRRRAARVSAGLVILISVVTLGDWYGWGPGLDRIVHGAIGQVLPGRMPVATALAFLAFGLALLLLDTEVWRCRPTEFLSFAAALISLLALIAYSFSFVSFFRIASRRALAFHTVLLLLVFSFGILAARPRRGLMLLATSNSVGGAIVRRMLPAAVGIPVLAGWLIMEGQRGGLYPPVLNLSYYALSIVVVFSTLTWFTAVSLDRADVQRKKAEDQVRRLNAELEQRIFDRTAQLETANRELEAFSYSVSHDLRAPLRAIDGFSRILVEDHGKALGPGGEDCLERVCAASRRMGQLIDDLLGLARVTRKPISRRNSDLSAMANQIIEELCRAEPERRVRVAVEPELRANVDPNLIRIVLENLLRNAWKFTRTTPAPRVEVGAIRHEGRAAFFVRDNGAGFDMAYADKLFNAFQRLHREAEFEGTGIGLATVQRIIHRHGGQVWAEGAIGHGATFYFAV